MNSSIIVVQGNTAEVVKVEGQGRCMLDAGGYIFNTEAHPIDPAALACCSGLSEDEVFFLYVQEFTFVLSGERAAGRAND